MLQYWHGETQGDCINLFMPNYLHTLSFACHLIFSQIFAIIEFQDLGGEYNELNY